MAHQALGQLLLTRGEVIAAEEHLLAEIELHPEADTLAARRALVALYAGQQRLDEQLAQLEALRTREPPAVLTAHSYAQVLYNLGRYPEARVAVKECMALAPRYAPCVMLHANVLGKLGMHEDAEAEYHRALALAGEAPPVTE
jgi:tetratricopeptide (TPR) repeat protein